MRRFPKMPKSLLKRPPGLRVPKVAHFKEDMAKLGEKIAETFKNKIIYNIENNRYGFPLAEGTIAQKGSATPLIDSGIYLKSIYRDGTTVSVRDTARADTYLTNKQLAIVHEYGTKDRHIMARPVWRMTFKDFKPEAQEMITSFFKQHGTKSKRT